MKLLITVVIIVAALYLLRATRRTKVRRARDASLYPPPGQGSDADVRRLIEAGRKMSAIKLYREIHGVDLTTAKDAVERMEREANR